MYNSPIEFIYDSLKMEMDDHVVKAVQECHIYVDKEELIKALRYDRGQYEKGFSDGFANAIKHGEWIVNKDGSFSCSECKFKFYPLRFEHCPHCGAKMDADVIRHLEFLDKLKHCGADMRGGKDAEL